LGNRVRNRLLSSRALAGNVGEFTPTGVFKRIETFADGAPKHIGVDIIVVVAEHAAELTKI
jgi:hypothetical protein